MLINEMVAGSEVETFLMLSEPPQVRKSKKGSDYLILKLQDRTGQIDSRMWEIPPMFDVNMRAGQVVKVRGKVSEWNDNLQLAIDRMRLSTDEDAVDIGMFFEKAERPAEEMLNDLMQLINLLGDGQVKSLILKVISENKERFMVAPAAKGVHHNYIGGLLEHVLSLTRTSVLVAEKYSLRLEMLIAACVFHDIGKIHELTYPVLGYTPSGTLIGHISIGMNMVAKAIDEIENFDPRLKMEILHLIVSHHGLLEWGSPKIPLMKEAIAFHLIDSLDAKMAICDKAVKKGLNEEGFTEWVKELGGTLYAGPVGEVQ